MSRYIEGCIYTLSLWLFHGHTQDGRHGPFETSTSCHFYSFYSEPFFYYLDHGIVYPDLFSKNKQNKGVNVVKKKIHNLLLESHRIKHFQSKIKKKLSWKFSNRIRLFIFLVRKFFQNNNACSLWTILEMSLILLGTQNFWPLSLWKPRF